MNINTVWNEKHRPRTLADFIGQETLIAEMQSIIETGNMQHYLFHSRGAGTGKTSMAYILAEALGFEMHIFNASSKRQRGVAFIEEDIIPLSRIGQRRTLILLDEADRITPQAQDALKGVIEDSQAYFILTCNDLSKVSNWLKSRAQVRVFRPVEAGDMKERLGVIAARECAYVSESHIDAIVKKHDGDLRNAIGALQALANMPDEQKDAFILAIGDSGIPVSRFLALAVKEKATGEAVKLLTGSLKSAIKQVFSFAVASNASTESKMRVIEASIISERDLNNGVDEEIVCWDFCRMLAR
tara:strand:+ start:2755 stop:3654 length:900 start_codon:yes stop_codon:yes gene_type:complete